jgi:hypothetical protein
MQARAASELANLVSCYAQAAGASGWSQTSFPAPHRDLPPSDVENLLCIYEGRLPRLAVPPTSNEGWYAYSQIRTRNSIR